MVERFIPDSEIWLYWNNNNEMLDKAIKLVEKIKDVKTLMQ